MSTINSTFLLNQSSIVKLLGTSGCNGPTSIALPNQTSGPYVLTIQPNVWQTDSNNSGVCSTNDFKLSTIKDKYGLTVISNPSQEYSSQTDTYHSLTVNTKPLPSSSNCSNSITTSDVTSSSSSSTSNMATFIQTSNGGQYITPSLATSSHSDLINTISPGAINPHIITATTNQILGSNGALIQPQGGQFLIAQRGAHPMGFVGYPSTGAAVMMQQSQATSNGDSSTQILTAATPAPGSVAGPQLISTLQPSLSPMVQILLANGQILTTSLANLQAGNNTGFNPVPQQGSGQYTNYTGNAVPTGVTSSSTPLQQAQFVTNQSGQIFAITSPTMVNSVTGQTFNTHQGITGSPPTIQPNHYIQIATPSGIALVPANSISQLSTSQQLAQQLTTTSTCATNSSANEGAKVQVQQIIPQQGQLNLQTNIQAKISSNCPRRDEIVPREESKRLQQQSTSLEENPNENNITLGGTKIASDLTGHVSQAIQVSISSASSSPIIISPNVFQSAVSSTTSSGKTVVDSKSPPNAQTILSDSQVSPVYTSVESQTLSPAPSLSNASSMEPESTTHNTATVAHTINNTDASIVDGVNLEEIKEFARQFKLRRLSLGLTQTQVGQALSATEGPSYSQSAICRFEKLDITPKSAQKIKPVLEQWMREAEERFKNGNHNSTDFIGNENNKKRKRRTSFTPSALEILNAFFEKNTHPSSIEMTELADKLRYDREVVRVWFCNKRQALRNNVKKLEPSSCNVIVT